MSRFSTRVSSDLFLVVTSVIIACVIWTIAKSGDREQTTISVRVLLKAPPNIVARPLRDTVQVTATFPKSLQPHIMPANFVIRLDWDDLPDPHTWCGVEDFKSSAQVSLEPHQIHSAPGLAQDLVDRIEKQVKYTTIVPGKMLVEARFIARPAKIVYQLTGKPAEGYTTGTVVPRVRQTILVTASPDRFAALGAAKETAFVEVSAEEIDVAGRKATFTDRVRLQMPEGVELVDNDEQRIEVQVPIYETHGRKVIEKVPIQVSPGGDQFNVEYSQRFAAVTVQGPSNALRNLRAANLVVRPDQMPAEQGGLETTVSLHAAFVNMPTDETRGLEIVAISPRVLRIVYSWRQPPNPLGEPWLTPTR